jgi:hypothetical protein
VRWTRSLAGSPQNIRVEFGGALASWSRIRNPELAGPVVEILDSVETDQVVEEEPCARPSE